MPLSCLRVVRVVAVFLFTLSVLAGNAARAAERIELVSRVLPGLVSDTAGAGSTFPSVGTFRQTISSDGRYVVFSNSSTNLIPGQVDVNGFADIFLYDRSTGTLRLVSHAATGANVTGNSSSSNPSISADGRYVAFSSNATNLVPGVNDTNSSEDVFLFDRDTGSITLVSHMYHSATAVGTSFSRDPVISTDGNWVVFVSRGTNLMENQFDTLGTNDVFLWSRATNSSTLVTHSNVSNTTEANISSSSPVVSSDGSWVAYLSDATNLVNGAFDTNARQDAFLWSRATNTSRIVSRTGTSATNTGNNSATGVRISGDGAFVLFISTATNHVTGQSDTNAANDVFLFSRATGVVTLVSRNATSATTTGNGTVPEAALSADGNWVAFASVANNLVTGQSDTNATSDVFLWNRAAGTTELVTRKSGTTATTSASTDSIPLNIEISANGGFVAYNSRGTELVAGQSDTNLLPDLFVFDRAAGTNALISGASGSAAVTANDSTGAPVISADGNWVAFLTAANDVVPGIVDTNGSNDLLLHDRVGGTTSVVTLRDPARPSDTAGSSSVIPTFATSRTVPSMSSDGRYLAFESLKLLPGQTTPASGGANVYLYDRQTGTITLISRSHGTTVRSANGESRSPFISSDGRWVLFNSRATDLVPGQADTNFADDVFLWDRLSEEIRLVSHAAGNPTLAAGGGPAGINADGSSVIYQSTATNLVAGQSDGLLTPDTFVYDRATGESTLVSHRNTGLQVAAGFSSEPWISADGRFVSFLSTAANVVAGQTETIPSSADLFLWDRTTGDVTLVSSSAASATAAVGASSPALSADGNWLAFSSTATNLVAGLTDTNNQADLFLWERATGARSLVSRSSASASTTANNASQGVGLNPDGSRLVFLSRATNLVAGATDANVTNDVFVYERSTGQISLASHTPSGPLNTVNGACNKITLSDDGSRVAFLSTATNLVAGQTDSAASSDIFLYDVATGAVKLVSHQLSSLSAGLANNADLGTLSSTGSVLAWSTVDPNVLANDFNARSDVFLWIDESGTDLAIAKTDGLNSAVPGQPVTYTITATNAGPTPTGATVTDSFPAALQGVTWTCVAGGGASCAASGTGSLSQAVNLPVNGTVTFTVTGTVAADATGTLANTASITPGGGIADTNPANNSSTDTDSLTPLADLAVAMSDAPDPVGRGAVLTYLISVTNAGPSVAASVSVTDTLPAGVSFTGASGDGWSCGEAGGVVTCTRPSLAPGAAPALSIQVTAPVARGFATLTNTVAVAAATPDPVAANNAAASETSVPQPGITVAPVSGLTTTEAGGTATFTVVLDSAPLADVTIPLASGDTAEGTVSPAILTFTTGDWSTPRTVTVTGVDDDYDDGSVAFTVSSGAAVSADAGYAGIDPADVAVTNEDDDTAGFTVSAISGPTTEAGGMATFTVVLTARPRADVTVGLTSDDTGEGTIDPESLTFTTDTWSTQQTVTVTGVDDDYVDGEVAYTISTGAAESTDAAWAGLDPADVDVTNQDDDAAGIEVSPTGGLVTTEGGGTATFTVTLAARPSTDVTISLESSDTGEGQPSPATLTFTTDNWDTPQTVTVTGQDDDFRDGDVAYTIVLHPAQSGDPAFAGIDPADVAAVNRDDSYEGVYHTITPCRLVDTRQPGYGPALENNQVAIVMVHGACGIPSTARAVAINLTFSGAGQRGTVLVYPGDLPAPPVPEYLWIPAGRFARSLSTLMKLGEDGTLAIMPRLQAPHLNPTVHIVLDVSGYFD